MDEQVPFNVSDLGPTLYKATDAKSREKSFAQQAALAANKAAAENAASAPQRQASWAGPIGGAVLGPVGSNLSAGGVAMGGKEYQEELERDARDHASLLHAVNPSKVASVVNDIGAGPGLGLLGSVSATMNAAAKNIEAQQPGGNEPMKIQIPTEERAASAPQSVQSSFMMPSAQRSGTESEKVDAPAWAGSDAGHGKPPTGAMPPQEHQVPGMQPGPTMGPGPFGSHGPQVDFDQGAGFYPAQGVPPWMGVMPPTYPYMGGYPFPYGWMDLAGGKGPMQAPWPQMPMYMPGMTPAPNWNQAPNMANGNSGKRQKSAVGKAKTRGRRGRAKGRAASPTPAGDDENVNRSEALNEVKKNPGKCKLSNEQILEHAVEFAKDKQGSTFLQQKLDEVKMEDEKKELLNPLFEKIKPHTSTLASDVFGNFVVQKFFDLGSVEQRKELAQMLKPDTLKLSMETYGCRVIQKALTRVPKESQLLLGMELKKCVGQCIENMHANHVIQKCIEQMPPESVTFIIKAVEDRVAFNASHMYGCRVIQRLLEHCKPEDLSRVLEQILLNTYKLASDPYGNYVVQHMLEHGRQEDKKQIIETVRENLVVFSKNKHSSNVVEKCFEIATTGVHAAYLEDDRQNLMKTVLSDPTNPNSPLQQMVTDKFGNYIVQRVLEYCQGTDRETLRQVLYDHDVNAQSLKSSVSGKHVYNACIKEFGPVSQPGA